MAHLQYTHLPGLPSATWREIKQLGWAVLMVVPMIMVVCYGAAGLVGARAALWIGVGLASLTLVTFLLIIGACLAVSVVHDLVLRLRGARRHRRMRQSRALRPE